MVLCVRDIRAAYGETSTTLRLDVFARVYKMKTSKIFSAKWGLVMGEVELAFHISAWPEEEFVRGLSGVAEAGFRAIELTSAVVPQYEDRIAVFQEMLARQGVTLAAIEVKLRPITLEVLEEEIERCANVARFLRANRSELLVLYPPEKKGGGEDAEDWKLSVEAINQIGKRTLDLDVRTCLHPYAGTIGQTRRELERLLQQTEPEFVRICADAGFLTWIGISIPHFFKKYKDRIDYVHVQDIRKPSRQKEQKPPRQAVFGRGSVDLAALGRKLEASDYCGWVTVECPGPHQDPVAVAKAAGQVARRVLNLL